MAVMGCISAPEPGWRFESRHGTHAREVAAQALLKLVSGGGAMGDAGAAAPRFSPVPFPATQLPNLVSQTSWNDCCLLYVQ